MDLRKLVTDKEKEQGGVWITLVDLAGLPTDARVKVRRLSSGAYRKLAAEKQISYRHLMGDPETRVEAINRAALDMLVEFIVVGWEGFEVDGVVLEFTPENVRAIFGDPQLVTINDQVSAGAGNAANYQAELTEDLLKNLPRSSSVDSDTPATSSAT